jgi:TPP-dependent pyruvate/acetoin dehydrogenase alpha subunit
MLAQDVACVLHAASGAPMKRYAAYDPPEYLHWTPDTAILRAYRERIDAEPVRRAVVAKLSEAELLELYAGLLRNRLHDIALKRWVKGGVISKAWLGTGEEATTIGPVHALRRQGADRDVVAPMIRNAGACHEMGMRLAAMFAGYLGTTDSPAGGRDLHIGDLSRGILAPISHVGDVVPVVTGIALSFRMRGEDRVALTWVGDGSTKTAAFHEGVNFAAVQRVPAIFVIQNNQVALGTPLSQHAAGRFEDWPAMYGVAGGVFDGNHVLDAYAATSLAVERARAGEGVSLLVGETFRMGGHATHDEREARQTFAAELFTHWGQRDPIGLYEAWLEAEGIGAMRLQEIEAEVIAQVEAATAEALKGRDSRLPPAASAAERVYADQSIHTNAREAVPY